MVKLKYEGEGIICQFGEYADGWTGQVGDFVAVALLRVPGFSEIKEAKEPAGKGHKKDGGKS